MAIAKLGIDRNQISIISLNDILSEDILNELKVIDTAIDLIDLNNIGYVHNDNNIGASFYSFHSLFKLLVLGNKLKIRSSRELSRACTVDLRFIWLLEGLTPKRSTINRFRANNAEAITKAFYELNRILIKAGLMEINDESTDGFKIKANNNKDNNFSINKLVDRITRCNTKIDKYENIIRKKEKDFIDYLASLDNEELINNEDVENECNKKKLEIEKDYEELIKVNNKLIEHNKNYDFLLKNGLSQYSTIDTDAKLMPNNGKFDVCYNVQATVNMYSHLVSSFSSSNNPSDIGALSSISKILTTEYSNISSITNTTDKGYNSISDMVASLENGVIPQVTPLENDVEDVFLETIYEENEITDKELNSNKPEDIKKCLRSGKIPTCYKDKIEDMNIVTKTIVDESEEVVELRRPEEIREEAILNGTFERDINTNIVYCPEGATLTKKSCSKGKCKYANKLACRQCKAPCTDTKFKEVTFSKTQKTVIPKNCVNKKRENVKKKKVKVTVVTFKLKLDRELLKKRMQTSEHTQGTMKVAHNHFYFNVRGFRMVEADLALYFTSVNLKRICSINGAEEVLKKLEAIAKDKQIYALYNKKTGILKNLLKSLFFLKEHYEPVSPASVLLFVFCSLLYAKTNSLNYYSPEFASLLILNY